MPATGEPLLRVDAVSKSYRTVAALHPVLDSVSFDLRAGETTSLVGRSGSGKSTLISLIAGLMDPDAGQIVIDGTETDALDEAGRAKLRAKRIGVVLQSDNLIPFLTAAENVELAIGLGSGAGPGSRARRALEELGLGHRIDHLPRQLSGGEAQRVAVAVALANGPDLLLADEVVGQLDSTTADSVVDFIFETSLARGLAVLFVTHDKGLAERAERKLFLTGGRVVPA